MNPTAEKKNCWDVMNCGFGPGNPDGRVCPAASEERLNGVHGGTNAGRACWVVKGTLCDEDESKTFARKMETCIRCPFYRRVRAEEVDLKPHHELLLRTNIERKPVSRRS